MDYKYIEQLIERYWEAETSRQEGQILRAFFSQDEVPAHLARYQELFRYEASAAEEKVSADFETRMLEKLTAATTAAEPRRVVALRPTATSRLRPFFQAAASVSIVVLIGLGASRSFSHSGEGWDYNPASYADTYETPQQAYTVIEDGLEMFQKTAVADTTHNAAKTDTTHP